MKLEESRSEPRENKERRDSDTDEDRGPRAREESRRLWEQRGRAMPSCQPRNHMSAGYERAKQLYDGLGHFRLIEELDDDWKIDVEPQNVVRMHVATGA